MVYTKNLDASIAPFTELLTSCAKAHSEPFIYLNIEGDIIGANSAFADFFSVTDLEKMPKIEQWLHPKAIDITYLLTHNGSYYGQVVLDNKSYDVAILIQNIPIGDNHIFAIELKDTTAIERAKAAERYFNKFKKKLLINISHEFRTPMNAVLGFVDLLQASPLSSWQQEYVDLAGKSAKSMMKNIESLLELMQIESGDIQANLSKFNPFEVFEDFSHQFTTSMATKEIQWSVLIDPRLPLEIIGDHDKITRVLSNLIQNALKFTPTLGQILFEIIIIQNDSHHIEVEYALSDTGSGISASRMKTLLRPFSSAWENQHNGQDGLGIGLSLSHKYIDIMDSHLMLASEIDRGSRFSFRISHPIENETYMSPLEHKSIALYSHDPHSTQNVLLEKYFSLFAQNITEVSSLVNPYLNECDIVIIDIPHLSAAQVQSLTLAYPHLQIIAILNSLDTSLIHSLQRSVKSIITTPLLPSTLHKVLSTLGKTALSDSIDTKAPDDELPERNDNYSPKILVAEDNPINLRLLETILKQRNFRIVTADNGQKAVDAYLRESFDLVLMDIDMPVMDGLTANRLIKEIDKRDNRGFVPVIALTAHALIGDRERIIRAGLDAHLAKPIDKTFLLQTIDRYLKLAKEKRT